MNATTTHRAESAGAFECAACQDTGNDPSTGYRHTGYDEVGCPRCNAEDGVRCCTATPGPLGHGCANCGHPIQPTASGPSTAGAAAGHAWRHKPVRGRPVGRSRRRR